MSVNTTPATFVAGESPSAVKMNTEVRDFATGVQTIDSFTPAWTSSGTAPAIGNGTIVGRYWRVGKMVHFTVKITMGSTSTFGTGFYNVGLPAVPAAGAVVRPMVTYNDATGSHYMGTGAWFAGAVLVLLVHNSGGGGGLGQPGPTTPFTWAQNDILEVSGFYEAA